MTSRMSPFQGEGTPLCTRRASNLREGRQTAVVVVVDTEDTTIATRTIERRHQTSIRIDLIRYHKSVTKDTTHSFEYQFGSIIVICIIYKIEIYRDTKS